MKIHQWPLFWNKSINAIYIYIDTYLPYPTLTFPHLTYPHPSLPYYTNLT